MIFISDMDMLMSLWVPRKEGNCPTHFVVLRQGHIFCVEPLVGEEPWTAPELERAFQKICEEAEHLRGPTIAALTRDPRDTWAENREYLMKLGKHITHFFPYRILILIRAVVTYQVKVGPFLNSSCSI
jgi:hypothetical protein